MLFLVIFLLTIFDNMLKYPPVSLSLRGQQVNATRQQAKMTFQFACRKLQRSKDTGQQTRERIYGCGYAARLVYCLSVTS